MSTTELKIRVIGDPVLRKVSKPVSRVTERHRDILSRMAQTMYSTGNGVGLAAPQVGISECMIVVDVGAGLYKLINPKIISKSGSCVIEEGCLSVPDKSVKVKRAKSITVSAVDENGRQIKFEAKELLARVILHEVDHLCGKLIVDYSPLLDKVKKCFSRKK